MFGHDVPYDKNGDPIERGLGSHSQPTRNSIDAYIKAQTERRVGGPEPGFQEHLARMEAELAEYQAAQQAKRAAEKKHATKIAA